MNRSALAALVTGISVATSALAVLAGGERDAAACGGCFHPPTQTVSDITDERMLLSVSPTQTTLYDQIRYAGSPASFAWVLPIRATVTVGLSADVLFDSMDELTTTVITAPAGCPGAPSECQGNVGFGSGFSANSAGAEDGTVTVIKQQNVGPYATVQLHATDSSALNDWLAQNGFSIPADVTPVIDAYVTEGFDFLAMKLLPDQGVQAMRPVRVTMPGPSLSLPLRMAAVGTGATVGITIWVVSDGRYEPQNFPFFHIDDGQLVWDFSTESSNYTTLRAQHEAALGGKGWEIESSIELNDQLVRSVIQSGGVYGGGLGSAPPSDANEDYLPVLAPGVIGDAGTGAVARTADQVRNDDIEALFAGMQGANVRVTRIRSDVSHQAMTTDLVLRASTDQSELSNIRTVTQSVGLKCPIYDNCAIVGYGSPEQAEASLEGRGGCVASRRTSREPVMSLATALGLAGLVVLRVVRVKRRSSKKK